MTVFIDKNQNVQDTTGVQSPRTNAAVNPGFYPLGAPNVLAVDGSVKTTPINDLQIVVGGCYLSAISNPA